MNKNHRVFSLLAAFMLLAGLVLATAACNRFFTSPSVSPSGSGEVLLPETSPSQQGAKIALVYTEQQRDSDFGQAISSAIIRFSGEEGLSWAPYLIEGDSLDAAYSTIELSVKNGAEIIVLAGPELDEYWRTAQRSYSDVAFYVLDTQLRPSYGSGVYFGSSQGGYLAGYAAVYDGARQLFVLDDGSNAFSNYRNGLLLGAEAAAARLGLEDGSVSLETLVFTEDSSDREKREYFASLLEDGSYGVLFPFSEESHTLAQILVFNSSVRLIGFEPFLFAEDGGAVLATLRKNPSTALYELLLAHLENGGAPTAGTVLSQVSNGGMEMELSATGFTRFNQEAYDDLLLSMEKNMLPASIARYCTDGEASAPPLPEELPLRRVRLSYHDQSQPPEPEDSAQPEGTSAESAPPQDAPAEGATPDENLPAESPPPEGTQAETEAPGAG